MWYFCFGSFGETGLNNLVMRNKAVQGWRVKNRISCGCHVFDIPDDYRNVTIPKGAVGTLTGDMIIFPEGVDMEECVVFAEDTLKLREALRRDILPDYEKSIAKGGNYWEQTKALRRDDLLASRVALVVKWDGIYEQEPETLNCPTYIPWLELMINEIFIPRRADPLSPEEASETISEALELIHIFIGSEHNMPDEIVARAHKFFSVQAVKSDREQMKNHGCGCKKCLSHQKTAQA